MSDPVSNADVEDVLSSIRRLVSAGQPDQKDSGEAVAPVDNKLILTPAFRVFEGNTATTLSTGRDIPVETLDEGPVPDAHPEDLAEVVEATDIPEIEDTLVLSPSDRSFDAAADSQVDFEDNWDSAALGETAQVAFLHERMSRAAEEVEEVVARPAEQATTLKAAANVDAIDEDAEPIVTSVDVQDAPMAEIVDDEADFIDEAQLQEIVSRIVRDELKGEIGMQITQAVRRMVRREVTRALSLEKFED